jgi:hypothetical protein
MINKRKTSSPWLQDAHLMFKSRKKIMINKRKTSSIRDAIYKTRCVVLIIDNESYTNMARTIIVSKLNLYTVKHTKPYKL